MSAQQYRSARGAPTGERPRRFRAAHLVAVGMPLATAFVWFVWGALHPIAERGIDCLTPLIIAGGPIALLILQEPLDRFLVPLQPFVRRFPKPLRLGASLSLPVVLGLLFSSVTSAGFGALRITLVLSMAGAHVLLREPEVS